MARARAERSPRPTSPTGPGRSVLTVLESGAPTRLFAPRNHGHAAWVFATHLGGGFVKGDHVATHLEVGEEATLLFGTQAYTKIFRGESSATFTVDVAAGGTYLAIAEPIQAYAGATFSQRTTVHLAKNAECLLWEPVHEGRSARGERWAFDRVTVRTEVNYDGATLIVDATELEGQDGDLAQRMQARTEFVTILAVGSAVASALGTLATAHDPRVLVGIETREGEPKVTIVRAAGDGHESLTRALAPFLRNLSETLGDDPFARRW